MSALKNKIISHNISTFLEVHLLLFFFNYNHMSIEEWRIIKSELGQIEKYKYKFFKNQISNNFIKKSKQTFTSFSIDKKQNNDKKKPEFEKLSTLFQTPTFLMGINSLEKCKQVFDLTKKHKKLIFVGGIYQNQIINHLDLDYLLKVQEFAYPTLLSNLQYNLELSPVTNTLIRLCHLLEFYQEKKMVQKNEK